VLQSAELKGYLQQRVRTVVKERAQKIKKQLEEQGVTSADYTKVRVVRGQAKRTPFQARAMKVDPSDDFLRYADHVKDDLFVNTFYQFFTYAPPAEIAVRLETVAVRNGAKITIAPKNNITLIRCAVAFDDKGGDEDVIFACKQFLISDDDYKADDDDDDEASSSCHGAPRRNHDDDDDEEADDDGDREQKAPEHGLYAKRYLASFKRLKGSHLAYQKAIEDFYHSKEIMAAMDIEDILAAKE